MEWLLELDGRLLLWLKETFSHPILDEIMIFVSRLGNKGFIWIAIGILFLLFGLKNKKWRSRGFLVLFSLAVNFLACNVILKPLIDRTRPYYVLGYDPIIPPVGDPSFPSGHTAASFAAATAIYAINRKWGIAAYIFAAVMGFSRLYLGVHFPTDVLGGAILGTVMAKLVIKLTAKKMEY
ncbi:phosphatase PAP2 family protein [Anaerotignum sp.]